MGLEYKARWIFSKNELIFLIFTLQFHTSGSMKLKFSGKLLFAADKILQTPTGLMFIISTFFCYVLRGSQNVLEKTIFLAF